MYSFAESSLKLYINTYTHSGDTGYPGVPVYKEVGRHYPGIILSCIPIGAYEPRDFMCAQHVNPEESVCMHEVRFITGSISFKTVNGTHTHTHTYIHIYIY